MTTYMTRAPLQPLENPHIMSGLGEGGRRTSARLAEKEDVEYLKGANIGPGSTSTTTIAIQKSKRSATGGSGAKTGSKRKQGYDEEDDGFAFSRTRSKKSKPAPAPSKEEATIPQTKPLHEQEGEVIVKKKPRKKSFNSPTSVSAIENLSIEKKRRQTRQSNVVHEDADPPTLTVKKRRKPRESPDSKPGINHNKDDSVQVSRDLAPPRITTKTTTTQPQEEVQSDPDRRSHETQAPTESSTFDATKIALPFADTPIIRRNKEMRKGAQTGSRRSSLGLRGRRASSLIDAGKSSALPHGEVDSSEFYRHIESEGLSEPRRMRQLLMWCGARVLGDKPAFTTAEDGNARLAAREIQSQLLKDFATRSELSDWFSREESKPPVTVPMPNPKNLSNLAKIEELEGQISRLQTESQAWQSLLRPPAESSLRLTPPTTTGTSTPKEASTTTATGPQSTIIDKDLLPDPTQQDALNKLLQESASDPQTSLAGIASRRLHSITSTLEFEIDRFGTSVHALGAYKSAAERVADETLGLSAQILERRDREGIRQATTQEDGEREEVGTRDVLRTLSRVIDR